MLTHRLRRWLNIGQALGRYAVFAGLEIVSVGLHTVIVDHDIITKLQV